VAKGAVGKADELTVAFVAERSPVNAHARHPLVANAKAGRSCQLVTNAIVPTVPP
jgi:hypothetical protein